MKKIIVTLIYIFCFAFAKGQSIIYIISGTTVLNNNAHTVAETSTGSITNNGSDTGVIAGTEIIDGGITFGGTGSTGFYNLVFNSGASLLNSKISVYDTANIAGGSVNANNNLWIRSDVSSTANLVVNGALTGNVHGLIAKASETSGGLPYFTSILSLNVSGPVMQYQWQSSPDNATWANVPGAINANYTATVTATVYYRCNLSTTNTAFAESTPGVQLISVPGVIYINAGTTVLNNNANIVVEAADTITNNGSDTGVIAGTEIIDGGITFGGTGSTGFYNLVFNSGASLLNSKISVYDTANIVGGSVNANNNLWIRSDISSAANLVVNGSLTGNVQGLIAKASVTTGGCPSYASLLSLNVSGSVMKYQWESSPDNLSWVPVSGATNATYSATVTATVYYHCQLTTSNTAFAETTPAVQLTYTGSIPSVLPISGPATVCAGSSIALSDNTPSGSWFSTNTAVAVINSSGVITAVSAGSVAIAYAVFNLCGINQAFTVVTVNAASPVTGTTNVCTGSTIALTDADGGGVWTSNSSYVATVGPASGIVAGVAQGTAMITYTSSLCGTITTTITVNQSPSAVPTNDGPVCSGGNVTLLAVSVGATQFTWAGPNLTSTTNANTTAIPAVTSVYSLTVGNVTTGCINAAVYTTTVTVNTTPTADPTNNGPVCTGGSAQLFAAPGDGATLYSWAGPSGFTSTAQNPLVTPLATTVYSLTVSSGAGAGCSPAAIYTTTVIVNAAPTAAPINNSPVCAGGTAALTANPAGGAVIYSWSGPGGFTATIANPSVSPAATGIYSLTVSSGIGAGCASATVFTTTITVNPPPSPITGNNSVCNGLTTILSDAGGGTWSSNNAAVATIGITSGIVTGGVPGNATITYTLGTGCITTATVAVNALSPITGNTNICTGTTTLSDAAGGGVWSSNNNAVASVGSGSGIVTSGSSGAAVITYQLSSGCATTTTVNIGTISAIAGTGNVCTGFTIALSDASSGGNWSTGSAGIATVNIVSGIVTGVAAGSANITYTLGAGCYTVAPVTVSLGPAVITGAPTTICAGSTTTLFDNTTGGVWSSQSTSISVVGSGGIVMGITGGTSVISYTTGTGCVATKTVTVNPSVPITGVTTVCQAQTIGLSNGVVGGTWSSSNAGNATVTTANGVVTGVAVGTPVISYTNPSGCINLATVTVLPLSGITGVGSVCQGQSITLFNTTPGGGTWSSNNTSVAVVGSTGSLNGVGAGNAGILFTTPAGCVTTKTITVNPTLPITGITTICTGQTTMLSSAATGGTWSSSNGAIASVAFTGLVTGGVAGSVTIGYTASSGCSANIMITVNATPSPISGATNICSGSTTLSDGVTGGTWSSGNSSVATVNAASGVVTSGTTGTAVITYKLGGGCLITTSINVSPLSAITGATSVCAELTTILSDAAAGGTWSSSNSSVATIGLSSGVVMGVASGTVIITYTHGAGCYVVAPLTVTASPAVITGTPSVCTGSVTNLSDITSGGVWSSLSTTIATIGSTGIVTGVSGGTTVISYLVAGCPRTATVTVQSAMPITGITAVCVGQTTALSNAATGGSWSSSSNSYATVVASNGVVTGVAAGSPVITYSLPSGCRSTAVVTVSTVMATTGNSVVCGGQTLALYNNTIGGGVWSSNNTLVATVSSGGVVTGGATGITSNVGILFAVAGCATTKTVTVNASVPITGITSVCQMQTTALSNPVAGGTWSTSNAGNATVTNSGLVTGVAAGAPIISYTAPSGCISLASLTVRPLTVITGSATACVGHTTPLYNSTAGGTWSSGNVSIATIVSSTGVLSALSAGGAPIIYTTPTGCITTKTITVTVCPGRIEDSTNATEVSSVTGIGDIMLFPNPNKGNFTIKGFLSTQEDATVSIEITDMLGQLVYRNNFIAQNGNINEQLQLVNTIANSMYLVNVRSGSEQKVFHIVVER